MATIFTRIIQGDLPGRFVWRDETAVAFLSINPITTGHALVVPIAEVDDWLDLDEGTAAHVHEVARTIGKAQKLAFAPPRVGLIIAGFEVPHAHLHVLPISGEGDLTFANAQRDPDPAVLDDAAERLRRTLTELGHADRVAAP